MLAALDMTGVLNVPSMLLFCVIIAIMFMFGERLEKYLGSELAEIRKKKAMKIMIGFLIVQGVVTFIFDSYPAIYYILGVLFVSADFCWQLKTFPPAIASREKEEA